MGFIDVSYLEMLVTMFHDINFDAMLNINLSKQRSLRSN